MRPIKRISESFMDLGLEWKKTLKDITFPKSENEANVGIGCLDKSKKNLWAELDRVLQKDPLFKTDKKGQ